MRIINFLIFCNQIKDMVSESQLVKRFAELSTSQQSVETLSLFLMHHRRQSQTIVHVWAKELVSAAPDRKISKD